MSRSGTILPWAANLGVWLAKPKLISKNSEARDAHRTQQTEGPYWKPLVRCSSPPDTNG